jgi:hypothetical protein
MADTPTQYLNPDDPMMNLPASVFAPSPPPASAAPASPTFLDASNAPPMPANRAPGSVFAPVRPDTDAVDNAKWAESWQAATGQPSKFAPTPEAGQGDAGGPEWVGGGDYAASTFAPPRQSGPRMARVTDTQTQTTRQNVTPELKNALDDAREHRALLVGVQQERAEAQIESMQIEADAAGRAKAIEEGYLAKQQQKMAARQSYVAEATRKRDTAQEQFLAMEVDPDRYWQSQEAPAKIAKGIGVLLSGLGSGLQGGGPNLAIEHINQAIANDIDAQKANIAKAGRGIEMLDGAMARYQQEFENDALAENAAYQTSLRVVGQEVAQLAVSAKQADVRQSLEELSAQLKAQEAEKQADFERIAAGEATIREHEKVIPIPGGGGAAAPGSKDDRLARPDGGIPGFVVEDQGAFAQVALDDTEYRKLREKVAGARQMRQALQTMTSLRERYGAEAWNAEVVSQYNTARESYMTGLAGARGQGAMQEGEWERAEDSVPKIGYTMNDLYPGDRTLEKLKGAAKSIDSELNAWGTAAGGRFAGTTARSTVAASEAGEQAQAALGSLE